MTRIVLLNKPYGVLSQFTAEGRWRSLAEILPVSGVYAAGRLDADSEGLLVLTDSGSVQHQLANPRGKATKTYWAQIEGIPDESALEHLRRGVDLREFVSAPCAVRRIDEPPGLWPREPAIRFRARIPTCWLELVLSEGKNRQVRRMCAATGHPVLRLVRYAVGPHTLAGLAPGEWRIISDETRSADGTPRRRQVVQARRER